MFGAPALCVTAGARVGRASQRRVAPLCLLLRAVVIGPETVLKIYILF